MESKQLIETRSIPKTFPYSCLLRLKGVRGVIYQLPKQIWGREGKKIVLYYYHYYYYLIHY